MFSILQQIIKVILRQFSQTKNASEPMESFDRVTDDIQMRVNSLCQTAGHLGIQSSRRIN